MFRLEREGTLAGWLRGWTAWRQERALRAVERAVRRQTLLVRLAAVDDEEAEWGLRL